MKTFVRTLIGCSALAAALAAAPSYSSTLSHQDLYGESIATNLPVEDTVVVQPGEKVINVSWGDSVKFVVGDQSFSWHFDGMPGNDRFKLSELSPSITGDAGNVWIDVAHEYDGTGD